LAKDSIEQLFIKDYNWLYVILGGSTKINIGKDMTGRDTFFDNLSS
jgi:hypothetical protein